MRIAARGRERARCIVFFTTAGMVFFFTCSDPRYTIYMGRDKFENEHLIAYGWPEDIW